MCGDALQTFKKFSMQPERAEEKLLLFSVEKKTYVEPVSMATVKKKLWKLVYDLASHKSIDLFDEPQNLTKYAVRIAAQAINFEQVINGKTPPHLEESMN